MACMVGGIEMETVTHIAIPSALAILSGYFWIRGILKKRDSDMVLAPILAIILSLFVSIDNPHWCFSPVNTIGVMYMAMGIVLLVVGTLTKADRVWKLVGTSATYMALGFFLFCLL